MAIRGAPVARGTSSDRSSSRKKPAMAVLAIAMDRVARFLWGKRQSKQQQ